MNVHKGFESFIYLAVFFLVVAPVFLPAQVLSLYAQESRKDQLANIANRLNQQYLQNNQLLLEKAQKNNWNLAKKVGDHLYLKLDHVDSYQLPVYLTPFNLHAAKTIGTDKVKPGGELNLSLTGKGVYIGEWDQGTPQINHDYLKANVTLGEEAETTAHATHVAGTIAGIGADARYDGMAIQAKLVAYDWNNAQGEMINEVMNGMILSNHSYGTAAGWFYNQQQEMWQWLGRPGDVEDYKFGFYSYNSQGLDYVAFSTPEHLIITGAGNDRADKGPEEGEIYLDINEQETNVLKEPDGGADGYDCLPSSSTAKNVLTVGAVNDLISGYTDPINVQMTYFSGWGPTDDGRIKPDLVANGNSIESTYYDASRPNLTNLVARLSGTSFAAPSVTGSLALLQEHYNHSLGGFMLASTLKALAIHSAHEAGTTEGPDYQFGWGLMNTAGAAGVIDEAAEGLKSEILEEQLPNGTTFEKLITTPGNASLTITICWTDPPAKPLISNLLDNPTRRLINDLDLRLISLKDNQTYFPFSMDPSNPAASATRADNNLDNVEKIFISNLPAGEYLVRISHKGSLQDLNQIFSLIISGMGDVPVIISESDSLELVKIYHHANGPGWNQSWDLNQPLRQWAGVGISLEGRVISLDLKNNNLMGNFPSINLPKLETLDCSANKLTGMGVLVTPESMKNMELKNNQLIFDDLLPLIAQIPDVSYAPQDSIGNTSNIELIVGQSLNLNLPEVFQVANGIYTWYSGNTKIISGNNPTLTINDMTTQDAGIYYCTINHPNASDLTLVHRPFGVAVNPPDCNLSAEIQRLNATCGKNNGSISLDVQNGETPFQVSWNTGDTSMTLQNLSPGTYTASIGDIFGCTVSKTVEIQAVAPPEIILEAKGDAACGLNDGIVSVSISGGTAPYDIQWDTGQKTRIANNLPPGNHMVEVTDANQCQVQLDIVIDEIQGPVVLTKSTTDATCGQSNGKASITLENGSPPYSIQWDHGPTGNGLDNLSSGIYYVSVTDQRGCSIRDSVTLLNEGAPVVRVVNQTAATCGSPNGSATIEVQQGFPPYDIQWPSGQSGPTARNLSKGSHILTVTDSNNCVTFTEVVVEGADSLSIDLVAVSDATCEENNGKAIINVVGGSADPDIRWSNGLQGETADQLAPGTYTIWATDSTGCRDTLVIDIANQGVSPVADFQVTIDGLKANFDNNSHHAEFFRWEFGNAMWSTNENPTLIYQQGGNYTVMLIAASQTCGVDTFQKMITVSNTSTSQQPEVISDVRLFPNPVIDILTVDNPKGLLIYKLNIYNSTGQLVKKLSLTSRYDSQINIPVQQLSRGLYYMHLSANKGVGVYKFLKK